LVSKRSKHVCLVILAQAACLSVGLWVQNRYITSSTEHAALEQAWAGMDEAATRFLAELSESERQPSSGDSLSVEDRFERWLDAYGAMDRGLLIVDARWRVRAAGGTPRTPEVGAPTVGTS
jgi:hypothetical protein